MQYLSKGADLKDKTAKVKTYDLLLNSLWPVDKCSDEMIKALNMTLSSSVSELVLF